MPEFTYTARNTDGTDVAGSISATSRREVLTMLANRALFPLQVEGVKDRTPAMTLRLPWRYHIGTELLANSLSQLADLLQNGVALLTALKILAEQAAHPVLREVMLDIHDQVADGASLEAAMARHPRVFSELTINMVRAGSEGAFLEDALRRVADFLENQEELKGRVLGAMAYPAFLAVMGVIVTVVLIVFFVPKFETLFIRLETTGAGLPAATKLLLFLSDVFTRFGLFITIGLGSACWLLRRYLATESARAGGSSQTSPAGGRRDPAQHGLGPILSRAGYPLAQRGAHSQSTADQ